MITLKQVPVQVQGDPDAAMPKLEGPARPTDASRQVEAPGMSRVARSGAWRSDEGVDVEADVEQRVAPRECFGRALTKVAPHFGGRAPQHLPLRVYSCYIAACGCKLGKPLARATANLKDVWVFGSVNGREDRRANPRISMDFVPPVVIPGDLVVVQNSHVARSVWLRSTQEERREERWW